RRAPSSVATGLMLSVVPTTAVVSGCLAMLGGRFFAGSGGESSPHAASKMMQAIATITGFPAASARDTQATSMERNDSTMGSGSTPQDHFTNGFTALRARSHEVHSRWKRDSFVGSALPGDGMHPGLSLVIQNGRHASADHVHYIDPNARR